MYEVCRFVGSMECLGSWVRRLLCALSTCGADPDVSYIFSPQKASAITRFSDSLYSNLTKMRHSDTGDTVEQPAKISVCLDRLTVRSQLRPCAGSRYQRQQNASLPTRLQDRPGGADSPTAIFFFLNVSQSSPSLLPLFLLSLGNCRSITAYNCKVEAAHQSILSDIVILSGFISWGGWRECSVYGVMVSSLHSRVRSTVYGYNSSFDKRKGTVDQGNGELSSTHGRALLDRLR
jgi:hypothetical protein